MTPLVTTVDEEGVLFDNFRLVERGRFREAELHTLLTDHPYPARNPHQNIADLKAQIAANEKGVAELRKMVTHFGLETVQAYMRFVQANAELAVRDMLKETARGLLAETARGASDASECLKANERTDENTHLYLPGQWSGIYICGIRGSEIRLGIMDSGVNQ